MHGGSLSIGGTVKVQSGGAFQVAPGANVVAAGSLGSGGFGVIDVGAGGLMSVLGGVTVQQGGTLAMRGLDSGGNDVAVIGPTGALNVDGAADIDWNSTIEVYGSVTVGGGSWVMGNPAAYLPGTLGNTLTVYTGGTFSIDPSGTYAMRGFDTGGSDVAVVQTGGLFDVQGAVEVAWNSAITVDGTLNIGIAGSFQMGDPAGYNGDLGNTLTIGAGGVLGIDAGGTFAMKGMDSGGSDVAIVEPGGSFDMQGSALFGWNSSLDVYGTTNLTNGATFQLGDLGFAGHVPGDAGGSLTIHDGGSFGVDADSYFQTGMRGLDSGGSDIAHVELGGTFDLQGTVDVQNGNTFTVDGVLDPPPGSTIHIEDTSRLIVGDHRLTHRGEPGAERGQHARRQRDAYHSGRRHGGCHGQCADEHARGRVGDHSGDRAHLAAAGADRCGHTAQRRSARRHRQRPGHLRLHAGRRYHARRGRRAPSGDRSMAQRHIHARRPGLCPDQSKRGDRCHSDGSAGADAHRRRCGRNLQRLGLPGHGNDRRHRRRLRTQPGRRQPDFDVLRRRRPFRVLARRTLPSPQGHTRWSPRSPAAPITRRARAIRYPLPSWPGR